MNKLILDTNIIISSLIQKNYPYLILEHCIEGYAQVCVSSPILQEYLNVVARDKFTRYPDFKANADFLLTRLSELFIFYKPQNRLDVIKKDEPDNRLLELAEASNADFIITGNTNDFKMKKYKMTRIVSPREYWENYK